MNHTPFQILVVDDEPGLLCSLVAFLEDMGYQAYSAHSGEECLLLLQRQPFDAVIIDIRLPGIDGNEVILEASRLGFDIPFLIHTGSTDYQLPFFLRKLGFSRDDVFLKPVADLNHLCQALQKKISAKAS